MEKVLRLTRRKEKYLVVAAVRFLRTCISLKVCCLEPVLLSLAFRDLRYKQAMRKSMMVMQNEIIYETIQVFNHHPSHVCRRNSIIDIS